MLNKRATVLVAGLALVLAACGGSDEPAAPAPAPAPAPEAPAADACAIENLPLFAAGTLTVATGNEVFPPWMLDNDPAGGEGFENGLVSALAAEMGFDAADVAWVGTEFSEAIAPGAKDYDFNIQQYSIAGVTWVVGTNCRQGVGVNVELSNVGVCTAAATAALRPDINNLNWGGIGSTVGQPSQRLTLVFRRTLP